MIEGCTGPIAMAPDGKTLAASDPDGIVAVWNLATRQQIFSIQEAKARPNTTETGGGSRGLTFSPDGDLLAVALNNGTAILDAGTGAQLASLEDAAGIAFSPDGTTLAAGSGSTVTLWDSDTWKRRWVAAKAHRLLVTALAFSSDGKTLASVGIEDDSAKLWNVATGDQVGALKASEGFYYSAVFSTLGPEILAAGRVGAVELWRAADEMEVLARSK
jgi:WD40 repeat protein